MFHVFIGHDSDHGSVKRDLQAETVREAASVLFAASTRLLPSKDPLRVSDTRKEKSLDLFRESEGQIDFPSSRLGQPSEKQPVPISSRTWCVHSNQAA